MKIAKIDFNRDPNIGLFSKSTDSFCFVSHFANEKVINTLKSVLKVDVFRVSALGTGLVGVFLAGNSKGVIVSSRLYEEEIDEIKKHTEVLVLDTKYTGLGNMMLCNDKGCVISKDLEKHKENIENFLDVPVEIGTISGITLVGSLGVCNNKGCVVHKNVTEKEKKLLEKVLGVPVHPGTVNFGNPWVRSGLIANSNGCLVGNLTSGPEMGVVSEALGFL